MDLNDIRIFIQVVESESFSQAGLVLNMPSSTVSRKVKNLENSLGVRLLNRSTRKLSLTEGGSKYFQLCQNHMTAIEEANQLLMETQSKPKGKIRVTAPLDFAIKYVQPWVEEFLALYPDISLELKASDKYLDLVAERIDIAFRSGKLKDSSLIAKNIGPKHNVCCASPSFLNTVGNISHPKDLEQYDCIIMGDSVLNNHWSFLDAGKVLEVSVHGRYASNSMRLTIESALSGMGFAFIPSALAKPYLDKGTLLQVLKNYQTPISNMYIIYQSHQYMASAHRLFVDFVTKKTTPKAPWNLD